MRHIRLTDTRVEVVGLLWSTVSRVFGLGSSFCMCFSFRVSLCVRMFVPHKKTMRLFMSVAGWSTGEQASISSSWPWVRLCCN